MTISRRARSLATALETVKSSISRWRTTPKSPDTWQCRNGLEGRLIAGGEPVEPKKKVKVPRTHWDMLLERRSIEELEVLLQERLAVVRSLRGR